MNVKTTLGLLVLAGLGALLFWKGPALGPKLGLVPPPTETPDLGTAAVLETELMPSHLKRIELRPRPDADLLVLDAAKPGQWMMPGNWPLRQGEVEELVARLGDLRSRFRPVPLPADADLKPFGLADGQSPASVLLQTTDGKTFRLRFGRPEVSRIDDPFATPTYVRLDDRAEVLRLGPDLMDLLRRPREDYQRRQLFPQTERVKLADAPPPPPGRTPQSPEGVAVLPVAQSVTVHGPAGTYQLDRVQPVLTGEPSDAGLPTDRLGDAWRLRAPVTDRADPAKLRTALAVVPELWVERFVASGDKLPRRETAFDAEELVHDPIGWSADLVTAITDLVRLGPAEAARADRWLLRWTGLQRPKRSVQVSVGGEPVTLEIGKVARVNVIKGPPPPPPANPFQPPPPPTPDVREEFRFAKLADNPQVFEVRSDRLGDLFVPPAELRDPVLVRFRPTDARRLEIGHGSERIVLERGDKEDQWRLVEPIKALADGPKVTDLLTKLAGLRAEGADVIDPKGDDLKRLGFEPKSTASVTLSYRLEVPGQPRKGEDDRRPTRTVAFTFGKHEDKKSENGKPDDSEAALLSREDRKAKLYVRTSDRPRVNAVEDDVTKDDALSKLVVRPALAYRGRRLFDFLPTQVGEVAVQRGGEQYQLRQAKPGDWSLAIGPLSGLSVDAGKAGQLADELSRLEVAEYVTDKPEPKELADFGLSPPALTATVRFYDPNRPPRTVLVGKQRPGKADYFAKLPDSPGVFAVPAGVHTALDQTALAYRPLQLWQSSPEELVAVKVERRGGESYELKHAGPAWRIEGPFSAPADRAELDPLLTAVAAARAERYEANKADDLKRYGLDQPTLRLTVTAPERKPDGTAGAARDHTLLIGSPAVPEVSGHFAKLADAGGVFVVGAGVTAADKPALDLLDRRLLGSDDAFGPPELQGFQTANGPGGPVKLTRAGPAWTVELAGAAVPADREAAAALQRRFGRLTAVRFAAYGDKVDWGRYGLNPPAQTLTVTLAAPGGAPAAHTLALGKPVEDVPGDRYARLDNGPGVAVLAAGVVAELTRPALDYADRTLLKFDGSELTRLHRKGTVGELELTRAAEGWKLAKPLALPADQPTMEDLADRLGSLRAQKVVAWGASDLKPFGLDQPAATIELQAGPTTKVLKLGKPADDPASGDRYALVEGSPAVGVLPGALAKRLVAEPIQFRDHTLVGVRAEIDKAQLERGDRKATFTKTDDLWKMTEPLAADAEQADLDAFVNRLAKLRADEFVADKPPDLKPYGLDRPEVRWRLSAGGKEVLGLLVGDREKTPGPAGPRRYAKLATGELVFLLDPATTARVEGEYRKRSLSPTIDASQVETLAVNGSGGSFVLRKTGPTWEVQGMPGRAVNAERVNETLAALANLKVERFVLDKGADYKLFGLEPAKGTVVATSRSGVFTLQTGNREGNGPGVYARVPEPGRSDVFTLSAADAAKINRELTAYAAGK
jgi:hypothetical protein